MLASSSDSSRLLATPVTFVIRNRSFSSPSSTWQGVTVDQLFQVSIVLLRMLRIVELFEIENVEILF